MGKETPINAEIVSIGSELLLGQIVDTNAVWLAQRFTELGVNLFYKTTVGDNPKRMAEAIGRALERSDVVITGGGLGPTQDDITREVIADATRRRLVQDQSTLDQLEKRFRRRGLVMSTNNEKQAYLPEGAIAIENPNGTAPAFIVEDPQGVVVALPGVPFELKWLFDNRISPYLRQKFNLSDVITYRVLKVADMGESAVDERIGHLIANSKNPTVGVLAHPGQVDVRITAKASSVQEAMTLISPVEEDVRGLLERHVFAVDGETMEDTVGKLLLQKGATIAVYEELTQGLVAGRLLQASPEHFVEGIIGNGEASMRRLLTHSSHPYEGGQSREDSIVLTEKLAWAVRQQAGSDLGLAVYGVVDPQDRAENLARGQTFLSVTDGEGFRSRTYAFGGRGRPDRTRLSLNAVDLVRMALLEGLQ